MRLRNRQGSVCSECDYQEPSTAIASPWREPKEPVRNRVGQPAFTNPLPTFDRLLQLVRE